MRRSALENLKRYFLKAPLHLAVLILFQSAAHATPVSEYQKHLSQAIAALDSLAQIANENETTPAFEMRTAGTISSVRHLLPASETVESSQQGFTVDNSWLQTELEKYKTASATERPVLRDQVIERLQAIRERINEVESTASENHDKEQKTKKLAEILQRSEYARKVKQESAIGRLWRQFVKWLESLIPKPKPIAPGFCHRSRPGGSDFCRQNVFAAPASEPARETKGKAGRQDCFGRTP